MVDIYIPIAVAIAVFFLLSCCWYFRPSKSETVIAVVAMMGQEPPQSHHAQPTTHEEVDEPKGLDKQTIDSYPRVVIGESGRMLTQDDNMCSICLSKYHVNDTIKILPECLHRFHAHCLDEWLSLNATCPVCRIQPPSLTVVVS